MFSIIELTQEGSGPPPSRPTTTQRPFAESMNGRRGLREHPFHRGHLEMRRNWRLALNKFLFSSASPLWLMFVVLCLVEVTALLTDLPRSGNVQSDLLYVYDDYKDDIMDDGSSSRLNNDNHHHFHRRRHSNVGTNQETQPTANQRNRSNGCPVPCRCSRPEEKLHCKGGVSIIRDGCNCCFMCARQQGDLCDFRHRCDEDKDQFCDYTMDDGLRGICRAQSGRSCDVDGRMYKDGQHFQLNCSQLCTCQNGQYACASLCPQEERSPSKAMGSGSGSGAGVAGSVAGTAAYCHDLQLISIDGRCCKEWVCPHSPAPAAAHSHLPLQPAAGEEQEEAEDGLLKPPGDGGGGGRCVKETTGWSQCSVSCGFGWSVRLTNDNDDCLSVQERRLCIVRTCQLNDKHLVGRQCKTTWKETSSIRIQYDGCISVKAYRPKYCSTCKRKRCCRPELTKTLLVQMVCNTTAAAAAAAAESIPAANLTTSSSSSSSSGGISKRTVVEKMMWVKSCRCKEIYCKN